MVYLLSVLFHINAFNVYLLHIICCVNYFSWCSDKISFKSNLKKEGVPLAYSLRGHGPSWQEVRAIWAGGCWSHDSQSQKPNRDRKWGQTRKPDTAFPMTHFLHWGLVSQKFQKLHKRPHQLLTRALNTRRDKAWASIWNLLFSQLEFSSVRQIMQNLSWPFETRWDVWKSQPATTL